MLPGYVAGAKLKIIQEQDLAEVLRVVVVASQEETWLRLGLGLIRPRHVVEIRLQQRDQPRKRRSAVEFSVRRKQVRFVVDPRRHVDGILSVIQRYSLNHRVT